MKFAMIFEAVDRATKVISKVAGSVEKLKDKSGQASKAIGRIGSGVGKVARGAAVATGILASLYGSAALAAGGLTGTASEFERFQTILETTEGSSAKAKKAMGWVQDFAVKTPYELNQVTDAFVKLRAYGLDPTDGLLKTLGDTSAAMGKPLMQGVEAIADAVTGENERLKEFGIKAAKTGDTISYAYTNAAGQMKRVSVDATDRIAIQTALMEIFNEKFSGSMGRLSSTWDGMMSNMADQWSKFQMMIMNAGLFDWMKGKLAQVLDTINRMEAGGTLAAWATEIASRIQAALEQMWAFGTRAIEVVSELSGYLSAAAEYVGGWENLALILAGFAFGPTLVATAVGIMQIVAGLWGLGAALAGFSGAGALAAIAAGLGTATGAIKAMSVALLTNPIVLTIAAIAAAAYLIYDNWDAVGPYFAAIWDGITNAAGVAWDVIKAIFNWSPLGLLINNWGAISAWFADLWSGIKSDASAAWDWIKGLFDWSPKEAIAASFSGIGDTISGLISGAAEKAGAAWRGIKGIFSSEDPVSIAARDPASIERANAAVTALTGNLKTAQAVDLSSTSTEINRLTGQADALAPAVKQSVGAAQSFLAGQSFHHHGVRLMETLAQGMRERAQVVVEQIRATMAQVRDHLPSSPAKVGPLSDLHRLKFGETIAASIRSGPMVKAMRAATAATLAVATPAMGASLSARAEPATMPVSSGGGVTINYQPSITVKGGGASDEAGFKKQLEAHAKEIQRLVDEQLRLRERRSY